MTKSCILALALIEAQSVILLDLCLSANSLMYICFILLGTAMKLTKISISLVRIGMFDQKKRCKEG